MTAAVQTQRASSMLPMRMRLFGLQDPQSPTLLFVSRVQSRKIPLYVSPTQAEALAPFRGTVVEVTARVRYDEGLEIVDGELLDWSPLEEQSSAIDALRTVFLPSAR